MRANQAVISPRLATLSKLKSGLLSGYFPDLPCDETLRTRFKAAGVPFIKSNRAAVRGGGTVWWDVAAVERYLKSAIRPGGPIS